MKQGDSKRVKKGKRSAGSSPAASEEEKRVAAETMADGKGQGLVVAGRGLVRVRARWQ